MSSRKCKLTEILSVECLKNRIYMRLLCTLRNFFKKIFIYGKLEKARKQEKTRENKSFDFSKSF